MNRLKVARHRRPCSSPRRTTRLSAEQVVRRAGGRRSSRWSACSSAGRDVAQLRVRTHRRRPDVGVALSTPGRRSSRWHRAELARHRISIRRTHPISARRSRRSNARTHPGTDTFDDAADPTHGRSDDHRAADHRAAAAVTDSSSMAIQVIAKSARLPSRKSSIEIHLAVVGLEARARLRPRSSASAAGGVRRSCTPPERDSRRRTK